MSTFLVGILLIFGVYTYANIKGKEEKERYDAYKVSQEVKKQVDELQGNITAYSMKEETKLADECYNMERLKALSLVIGGCLTFVGILVVYLMFKKKYPYFSEKKYKY